MYICRLLIIIVWISSGAVAFRSYGFKTWWAKRVITDDYYAAGRLTVRDIKYVKEDGFKSIIALPFYADDNGDDSEGNGNYLPSTDNAQKVAALANIPHTTLLQPGDSWKSIKPIDALENALQNATRPVLYHCSNANAAIFTLLLYFARVTKQGGSSSVPEVSAADIFRLGASLGYDYAKDDVLVQLVKKEIGELPKDVPKPNVNPENWFSNYWRMKPIGGKWFIAGQILKSDIEAVKSTDLKSFINYRRGLTYDGRPSQEEVNLLNIKSGTGTYQGKGRQSDEELIKNRINPSLPNEYISTTSSINFEKRNPLEFGDDVGSYSKEFYLSIKDKLIKAEQNAPVFVHCTKGMRAAVFTVLHRAVTEKKDSKWALDLIHTVGIDIPTIKTQVTSLYQQVLVDDKSDPNGSTRISLYGGNNVVCFIVIVLLLIVE